jgi:TonB family protein
VRLHQLLLTVSALATSRPATATAQDSTAAPGRAFAAESLPERPTVLTRPPLHYPDSLRRAGIDGRVVVRMIVDTLGHPEPSSLEVLESPDSGLTAVAKDFALGSTFRPARRHGQPVRAWVKVPVVFDVAPPLPPGVYRANQVDEKPKLLAAPPLKYPWALRQQGVQGRVIVQAIIDSVGRVDPGSVAVVRSPDPGFDDACVDYILHSRFQPGRRAGRAVSVLMKIPIDFTIPK